MLNLKAVPYNVNTLKYLQQTTITELKNTKKDCFKIYMILIKLCGLGIIIVFYHEIRCVVFLSFEMDFLPKNCYYYKHFKTLSALKPKRFKNYNRS